MQLRLCDSKPAWLTPAVMPHPNVDLITPVAVASSTPAVAVSVTAPWLFPKLRGRVGVLFPLTKYGVSGTLPRTFQAKQMYRLGRLDTVRAAGSIVDHGHSVALRDSMLYSIS